MDVSELTTELFRLFGILICLYTGFSNLEKRENFKKRFIIYISITVVTSIVSSLLLSIITAHVKNNFMLSMSVNILIYLIQFALDFFLCYLCFDIKKSFSKTLYLFTLSSMLYYLLLQFFYITKKVISYYLPVVDTFLNKYFYLLHLFYLVIIALVCFLVKMILKRCSKATDNFDFNPKVIYINFFLQMLIFTILSLVQQFIERSGDILSLIFSSILCYIITIASTFFHMYLQYSSKKSADLKIIASLEKERADQNIYLKENMEMMSQKAHDLKHLLNDIKNSDLKDVSFDECIDTLNTFSRYVDTGNKFLDIILSNKLPVIEQSKIDFHYRVEKDIVSFLKDEDALSLFANALDNAIEHEKTLDENKRYISLDIKRKGSFIIIVLENYTDITDLSTSDLKTTKKDKENHGYGLKSIKHIVEKYCGKLSLEIKDNVFSLSILFER